MDPTPIFVVQFFWFGTTWAVLAYLFVVPWLRPRAPDDALAICLAPQLFRVLGLGLLVPALAPDMPRAFALPTAVGDSLTACLALIAVAALRLRWRGARTAAWACTIVGSLDLLIALPHAATIGAARFLAAQWYVPVLALPLMIVSHVLAFRNLVRELTPPARAHVLREPSAPHRNRRE